MNTIEVYSVIAKIVSRVKGCTIKFKGVLSADQLDNLTLDGWNQLLVCNILPISKKNDMGHWILLFITSKKCHVFDSYAFKLNVYGEYFTRFHRRIKREVSYLNKRQIQSNFSLVCGAYCVYIAHVIVNYNVREVQRNIRKHFNNSNKNVNDGNVLKLCYRLFGNLMPDCKKTFCDKSGYLTYNNCVKKFRV